MFKLRSNRTLYMERFESRVSIDAVIGENVLFTYCSMRHDDPELFRSRCVLQSPNFHSESQITQRGEPRRLHALRARSRTSRICGSKFQGSGTIAEVPKVLGRIHRQFWVSQLLYSGFSSWGRWLKLAGCDLSLTIGTLYLVPWNLSFVMNRQMSRSRPQ